MIVTIDGGSATGKSTVAKLVSEKLKIHRFDTGAMYRSFAYLMHQGGYTGIEEALNHFDFEIKSGRKEKRYFLNGEDITEKIRSSEISELASKYSKELSVRQFMQDEQRKFAKVGNAIFEGRDMGSAVFPEAEFKFFLKADLKERAKRRFKELQSKFPDQTFDLSEVEKDLAERDERDEQRAHSPLVVPQGALEIDTSKYTATEIAELICRQVNPPKNWLYHFFRNIALVLFKVFYRFKVYRHGDLPKGGALIACNHASFADPVIVGCAFQEEIGFLARKSLFRFPIFGPMIRKTNAIPISRGGVGAAAFRTIKAEVAKGRKVLIFPEGTRTKNGELQKVQSGIAVLAAMTKSPIIPVYIKGSYQAWGRGQPVPKLWGNVSCVIGKPIKDLPRDKEVIVKEVESALQQLKESIDQPS